MTTKVSREQAFSVLATNFSISPSESGYTLQISADGINFTDLFAVGANVTRMVTGVASGSYYKLAGNTDTDVIINWQSQCNDGQGGGGGSYILPPATQSTLGGIKVGSGLTITKDGTLSSNGGGSSAYKIELSASNPDYFTEEDIANLNAFFAAVEADPSIKDSVYVYADGDIFSLSYVSYNGILHNGDFIFVLPFENYIVEIDLSFANGEYTEGVFYENRFNYLLPSDSFPADPTEGQIANYDDGQGNIGLYRYDGTDWQPYGGGEGGSGVVYVNHLSDAAAVAAPLGTLIVLNEEEDDYQEHSIFIKVEGGEIASLRGYRNPSQTEPFEIVYDELEEFVNFCDGKVMFTVNYNGARYAYMDAANLAIVYYSDEQKTTELARLEYGGTARFATSNSSRYVDLSWEDNVIYFRKASLLESVQNIINFSTEGVHYHRITDNTKATAQDLGLGTDFMYGIPEWNNEGIIVKKKFNGENQYTQINYGRNNYSNRIGFIVADGASFLPSRMYIPTDAGTQGQVLTFDTINTAPVWATMIKSVQITSAAYEALVQAGTTDPNTLYLIVDE